MQFVMQKMLQYLSLLEWCYRLETRQLFESVQPFVVLQPSLHRQPDLSLDQLTVNPYLLNLKLLQFVELLQQG